MPFDLASAKPLVESGFDLGTAKPVGGEPAPAAPAVAPPAAPKKFTAGESVAGDIKEATRQLGGAVEGIGETGLSMVSGVVGSAAAGIAGAGQVVNRAVRGDPLEEALSKGADVTRKVKDAATYEPKSEEGKAIGSLVAAPMELAGRGLGALGEKAGALVGPKTAAAGRSIGEAAPEAASALLAGRAARRPIAKPEPVPGKDFSPLRDMSPEEQDRFHSMKSQGVEPTLGQVNRSPSQVRFEQQTAQTPGGGRLDQRFKEQDVALVDSVEKLKKGEQGKSEVDTGRSVRTALESKAAEGKAKINKLYDEARASGETKQLVDPTSLTEYFKKTEADSIAVPELKAMKASFEELQKKNKDGHISVDDLEMLREKAGKLQQRDGSVKSYMADIRKGIDLETEQVGGEKYKAARKARKEWGDEFEEGTCPILRCFFLQRRRQDRN